jgi:5-oxoprolinase (ATP-hydrolysing) subunit A
MRYSIDINCDMGEGMPNDAQLMPFIHSANISCGYHAGDEDLMQKTIELALEHHVKIGAHPSFPDRANFGRTNLHFTPDEICDMVKKQINILSNIAAKNHATLHHIKPHGALYNMAAKDEIIAKAIIKAILETDAGLKLYALSGSTFIQIAESMGIVVLHEVFADRTYQLDGSLTPRSQPNALLTDPQEAAKQILQMVQEGTVMAEGQPIPIQVDTICIHGDGAHAVEFATTIYTLLNHV